MHYSYFQNRLSCKHGFCILGGCLQILPMYLGFVFTGEPPLYTFLFGDPPAAASVPRDTLPLIPIFWTSFSWTLFCGRPALDHCFRPSFEVMMQSHNLQCHVGRIKSGQNSDQCNYKTDLARTDFPIPGCVYLELNKFWFGLSLNQISGKFGMRRQGFFCFV